MYTPKHFNEPNRDLLRQVIHDHPFATLVTPSPDQEEPVQITHLPMILDGQDRLVGHMARINPHWKIFPDAPSTAIFHGPHGYVSPTWYGVGNQVPTWNYLSVHVTGRPEPVNTLGQSREILDKLTAIYEAGQASPWSTETLPEVFLSGMMRGIVAFEMTITGWQGKFKLGQNKPETAKANLKKAMAQSPFPDDRAMLNWMERLED
ncbi:FMN-binding negative transcriptional regulator [Aestuariispira insulae]|uniref:PaiB family negative transcriptional regulator n=1 Tax=Aestuariispira insulae TaxID=1461337 RepID=A0A3D9HXQ7_9PROT|nr:FMN-binding negative transcriptional regulator [Aestuariispira insulae]RED54288.1 PaiB family negative transcriptional regulator [Aestuariispira insulae]